MANNATNKINHYKIKKRDNSQQIKYIIWPKNADDNQGLILQLVSKNKERKLKKKVKIHHGVKEQMNLAALKLIAQKGASKKL